MKRLSKVQINWSPEFAYAIGLITTDGNLSIDGRHIHFTSKDFELVALFRSCLGLNNKIGRKARGGSQEKKYFVLQFGDKNFYEYLLEIGLKPAKSKILENLNIPEEYFADFLRGCIDGDGNINIYKHPESSLPQLRVRISSASPIFLNWIKSQTSKKLNLSGGWIEQYPESSISVLIFAKNDSIVILKFLYYPGVRSYLRRKYIIAKPFLGE